MLTLPNLLTLSRIFAVPLLVYLLWKPSWYDYAIIFGLYCLVGITDYFDGYLARAQGTVSRLGVFLDPIATRSVAAVTSWLSARAHSGEPVDPRCHIPALVIISVRSPSRPARVPLRDPGLADGQPPRQVENDLQLVPLARDPRGASRNGRGPSGRLASLWAAAALTLVPGCDISASA